MNELHRVRLGVVAIAWAGLVLIVAIVVIGSGVGHCLGGVGPAQREAIAACHEAARWARWGPLASPVSWVIVLGTGWFAIAALDSRRHRRRVEDR